MKYKLKKKFDEMKTRKGTVAKGDSLTDVSQQEECDIYACLKKYGITTLVNKTMAEDYLYTDNTNRFMTLDDAVRARKEMEDYFKQQPARVRKVFGDNPDVFIEKYNAGQFDDFLKTGVLSQEMVKELKGETDVKVEESLPSVEGIPTDINKGNIGTVEQHNGSVRTE